MITTMTLRMRGAVTGASYTLKAARTTVGFAYQVLLAGCAVPVANGWTAADMKASVLDGILRATVKSFADVPLDPEDDGNFGNTTPQMFPIHIKLTKTPRPEEISPVVEAQRQFRDAPHTMRHQELPEQSDTASHEVGRGGDYLTSTGRAHQRVTPKALEVTVAEPSISDEPEPDRPDEFYGGKNVEVIEATETLQRGSEHFVVFESGEEPSPMISRTTSKWLIKAKPSGEDCGFYLYSFGFDESAEPDWWEVRKAASEHFHNVHEARQKEAAEKKEFDDMTRGHVVVDEGDNDVCEAE